MDALYKKLKVLKNCKVFKKADIPEYFHYRNNNRIAPIVIFPDLGYVIQDNPAKPFQPGIGKPYTYLLSINIMILNHDLKTNTCIQNSYNGKMINRMIKKVDQSLLERIY